MYIDLYDVCGTNSKKTGSLILSQDSAVVKVILLVVMEPIPISLEINNLLSILLNTVTMKQNSQLLMYAASAKSKYFSVALMFCK